MVGKFHLHTIWSNFTSDGCVHQAQQFTRGFFNLKMNIKMSVCGSLLSNLLHHQNHNVYLRKSDKKRILFSVDSLQFFMAIP